MARKNRPFALGLSCVLPGLGQFYNEQTGKGVVMLAGNIVGLTLMGIGFVESSDSDNVDPEAGDAPILYRLATVCRLCDMVND